MDRHFFETSATGKRSASRRMIERSIKNRAATVGADKGYDTGEFIGDLERLGLRAHVARKSTDSAVDAARATR